MTTIKQLQLLFKNKLDPLDLDLIIANSIKKPREFVLAYPESIVNKKQELKINKNAKRRINHEPLAYILGYKEFYGLDFEVNKNILVPRPETELLVEKVLEKINKSKATLIDIGTGSGNIIISLAKNLKQKNTFYGIDISERALRVARKNSRRHKVSQKIKFLLGNLLKPFLQIENYKLKSEIIFIVANLPYLDHEWKNLLDSSESSGLKFEPKIALEGGNDGLDLYRKLSDQIKLLKNKKIYLFCEIGYLQKNEIRNIFSFAKKTSLERDLAGKWRIFKAEI